MASLTSPAVEQPLSSADIVGFNLQNATAVDLTTREITFGEVFLPGAVQAGAQLTATVASKTVAVQMDAKTFNADGTVATAVITLAQPVLAAGTTLGGMLSLAPAQTAATPAISLSSALANYALDVNLAFADGTSSSVDVVAAMKAALAAGTVTTWLSGSQATQSTVDIPVSGALRVVATITAYANGTLSTKVGFDNDIAMGPTAGDLTYSATIVQNGVTALSQPTLTQFQYEDWNATVYSDGSSAPAVNVQHDVAYLEATNAVPNYDLTQGVGTALIANEAANVASAGWDMPLTPGGITQYMPTTGGRGDIGLATQGDASWLISQNATAEQFALGQADAANGIPWHMWDASAGAWLDTQSYSNLWTDSRGGAYSYTTGLTQHVSDANNGWTADAAHQPDPSYTAYLLTGDNTYLGDLNAQAAYAITDFWPTARNEGADLVVQEQQTRGAAWDLREIQEASYVDPAGSEKDYFTQVANSNWSWLVGQIPAWTASEGQAYGYLPGQYGPNGAWLAPWQQDYFATVATEAAQHGNADALTFLKWEANYLVGRFLNADQGGNPHDGIAYNITVGTPDGTPYTTWAQINAATIAAGYQSNGTGWANSGGDYGELGLETLADIITLTGSTDAIKAYNWLMTSGAPAIDAATRQSDVQYNIIPRLPAGMSFAADGTIVVSDGSTVTTTSGPITTPIEAVPVTDPVSPVLVTPVPVVPAAPVVPVVPPATTTTLIPTPIQVVAPVTVGSGSDILALQISEDAYLGNAQFTIAVDGLQVGGVQTATASHASGATQEFDVLGSFAPGPHSVAVDFLNDLYAGTPTTDRNLYVNSATIDATVVPGATLTELSAGSQGFALPLRQTTLGSGSHTLALQISEDAYLGDAQFTVAVDGLQVGGVQTATALHSTGATQEFDVLGNFAAGAHSVTVDFLNDANAGSATTDRNLYVKSATIDGVAVPGSTITELSGGPESFNLQVTPVAPMTLGSGSDTLALQISEDAHLGNAQFTIAVDGVRVGGVQTATASHAFSATQEFNVLGSFAAGAHNVAVDFLNDLYAGTPTIDRNLYVTSGTIDGSAIQGASLTELSAGSQSVAFQPETVVPGARTDTLDLNVSEDAHLGDAQFTVFVDGKQAGGVYTATASHAAGQTQDVVLSSSWGAGQHTIGIDFLNVTRSGSGTTGPNLYVSSASYDGASAMGLLGLRFLPANTELQVAPTKTLSLAVSEDAYQGDGQFTVAVDGKQMGGMFTATALNASNTTQTFSFGASLTAGLHDVAVSFLNDLSGGTAALDRNLYVKSMSYDGTTAPGSTATLLSTGTSHFDLTIPTQ